MTPANVKALAVGGVVVVGGIAGALFWNAHHGESPVMPAKLASAPPEAPSPPKAAPPQPTPPKDAPPKVADLATPPPPSKSEARPEPPAGHGEPPHFDVVRVEPSGDAVLAGKGDPNAKVSLLDSGKVVAEAKTDASGNFVILPPTLKPGSYDLSLRQSEGGKPATDSKQNVAVSVPTKPGDQVVVALAEPGKPTKLLTAPPKAPEPAAARPPTATALAMPSRAPDVAIRSAEVENGTGFYATGTAAPGTRIELYLNGAHLAQVVAGPDGQWSVTVKRGLTGGRYAVRADAIGPGGQVVARAEVPFDLPLAVAEAAKLAPKAPEPPKPSAKASEPPKIVAAAKAPKPEPVPAVKSAQEKAPESPKSSAKASEPPKSAVAVEAPKPEPAPAVKGAEEKAPESARSVAAAEAATEPVQPPDDAVAPSTPPAPWAAVPAPQPEAAAAAKAAAAAAPAIAPPTLAVAPPTPPAERKVVPPQQMSVAPAMPATGPATLADAKPSVAPPAEPTTPAAPPPTTASSANAVIETVETALVVPGDNLWNISRVRLGDGFRYTRIYAANVSQIRNPSLIYPGQVFVVPNN